MEYTVLGYTEIITFALKSEVLRKVRSVNLTDDACQWLVTVADKAGISRNDYLKALAESSYPFIETANPQLIHLWKQHELKQGLQIKLGNLRAVTDWEMVVCPPTLNTRL